MIDIKLPKGIELEDKIKLLRWRDPVLFFQDVTGDPSFDYQKEILQIIPNEKIDKMLISSGGNTGKTRLLACIALWSASIYSYLILRKPYSVIIESGSLEQSRTLYDYLKTWLEVNPILMKLVKGEPLKTNTEFTNGSFIKALPASWKSVFGQHSSLLICDEAAEAEDALLDDSLRVVGSNHPNRRIFSSTPHDYNSKFVYMWEKKEEFKDWKRFSWRTLDCPLWTRESIEEAKKKGDMYYKIFHLGEPYPLTGTMIPPKQVNDCRVKEMFIYDENFGYTVMGIDFAWAPDYQAVVIIQRNEEQIRVLYYEAKQKEDPEEFCSRMKSLAIQYKIDRIFVDSHNKHLTKMLINKALPIYPVSFKGEKSLMQANLCNIFAHGKIKIPEQFVKLLWQLKSYCYSDDTEVLTQNGFKLFKDLSLKDKIATLSKNHYLEYQHPSQIVSFDFNGDLIGVDKSDSMDFLVTPNHRMYVKIYKHSSSNQTYNERFGNYEIHTAESLLNKTFKIKRNAKWKGREIKEFVLPSVSYRENGVTKHKEKKIPIELWLRFLGFFISEGCTTRGGRSYITNISQSKDSKYYEEINKILNKLGDIVGFKVCYTKDKFTISNKQLYSYLKQFGKSGDKFVPKLIKKSTRHQLEIFMESYLKGDGTKMGNVWKSCITKSKQLADDIQEILLKIGLSGSTKIINRSKNRKYYRICFIHKKLEPTINFSKVKSAHMVKVPYKGKVYCAIVPNHLMLVRRNGKIMWSGNTYSTKSNDDIVDGLLLACIDYRGSVTGDLYFKKFSTVGKKKKKFPFMRKKKS